MNYVLGVDLGTTFSAAAVARGGRAEMFTLGTAAAAIPSVVVVRAEGDVLVGEAAERRALSEPSRTAREFKRRLGDPTPLVLGGTPYGAEALTARLLRAIVDQVAQREGVRPDLIVLTHPANYGAYMKGLLSEAARQADVGATQLLSEPEAAAISYSQQERLSAGEMVAVYDFGGGTFDAAVLRKTEPGFELIGTPEGIDRLGGVDFDHAVFAYVQETLGDQMAELDRSDPDVRSGVARVRNECRAAKEALSADTDASVTVLLPNVQTEVRLTRPEFEAMIRPRLAETIAALVRTVASAGVTMADLDRVLLVGGSSRIPLVGQLVREATGRPVVIDAHPKFAIALGAALSGSLQAPGPPPPVGPSPPAGPPPLVVGPLPPGPIPAPQPGATTATTQPQPTVPAGPATPATNKSRRTLLAVTAVVVLALAAAAAVVATQSGHKKTATTTAHDNSTKTSTPPPTTVDTAIDTIKVGRNPDTVAIGGGSAWIANSDDRTVSRIDPATDKVTATIGVGESPEGVAVSQGSVWVANLADGTVARIDTATNEVSATINVGRRPNEVAVDQGSVWVTNSGDGTVSRIDAATEKITATIDVGGKPKGVKVGAGSVWVTKADGTVIRIDPTTDHFSAIDIRGRPDAVAVDNRSVWVTNSKSVSRIDAASRKVIATINVESRPRGVAVGAGSVWVTNIVTGKVLRIDPATNKVSATIAVGRGPDEVAVGEGSVWVTNYVDGTVSRIRI